MVGNRIFLIQIIIIVYVCLCSCMLCICGCMCHVMTCMWRSEENFVESVPSFTFMLVMGIKHRPSGLCGECLYMLSHLDNLKLDSVCVEGSIVDICKLLVLSRGNFALQALLPQSGMGILLTANVLRQEILLNLLQMERKPSTASSSLGWNY